MEEIYREIAPFSDKEVKDTLIWLENSDDFIRGVQFFYPEWSRETIVNKLRSCQSCADFQVTFLEKIIKDSIRNTMTSFEVIGLENIDATNSLFIANHRDIFLDSALLQNHLYDQGLPFTEISLGDNLMVNETMRAVAKLNNMFTVYRGKRKADKLRNSINLSKYIRYSITEKKVSSWIAQNNGRTKDGNDVTAPGLIKMLLLSGGDDVKRSVEELNIVVSTISFEYEPCAFSKARELSIRDREGFFKKTNLQDIQDIVSGIHDFKGNVRLVLEALNTADIPFTNNRKKDVIEIARAIDRIVYKNYRLWKPNYMAYDLLLNKFVHQKYYTPEDLVRFKEYLKKSENEDVYYRVLKMYANPVYNKMRTQNRSK